MCSCDRKQNSSVQSKIFIVYIERGGGERELTISLHFFMVSRFPRPRTAFRALEEKLRDDSVSDKFAEFGTTLTIIRVFEFPPTEVFFNKKSKIVLQPD